MAAAFLWISLVSLLVLSCEALSQCEDSLAACLVEALEFDIPDSSTVIGFDTLRLRDLKCNQGQIGGLQSSYVSPSNLKGELTDVKLHCDGRYSYGLIHGNLNAAVSISALLLDALVTKNPDTLYPGTLSSSSCDIKNFKVKLTFTGGTAGEVLNVISPLIESIITDNVKSKVCIKLSDLVSVDGTSFLTDQVDPTIKRILDLGLPDFQDPTGIKSSSEYVIWENSLLSSANDFVFDANAGRVGNCFFGTKKVSKPSYAKSNAFPIPMDSIISHYTNGTGRFTVDLGPSAILPIPSKTGSNPFIRFRKMTISGLESSTILDVLHPSLVSNQSLTTSVYLGHLDLAVDFSFCSDVSGEQVCDRTNSSLITRLENVNLNINCSIGAVQKTLNSMHLEDLFSMKFWLSAIDYVNITSLSLVSDVNNITIEHGNSNYQIYSKLYDSDLDTGIAFLVNNALSLVVSDYRVLVGSIIEASVQGPIRHTLNKVIKKLLEEKKVNPTHSRYEDNFSEMDSHVGQVKNVGKKGDNLIINWAEFAPLLLFRSISDDVTPEALNSFILCLSKDGESPNRGIYRGNSYIAAAVNGLRSPTPSGRALGDTNKMSVAGLNSTFDVSIFEAYPIDDHEKNHNLVTGVGIGGCDSNTCTALDLTFSTQHSSVAAGLGEGESTALVHPSSVLDSSVGGTRISIEDLHLQFEVLSELTMGNYRSLQLGQLAKPGCPVSVFQRLSLESIALQVDKVTITTDYLTSNSKALDVTHAMRKYFKLLCAPGSILQINNFLTQFSMFSKTQCQISSLGSFEAESEGTVRESLPLADPSNEGAKKKSPVIMVIVCVAVFCFLILSAVLTRALSIYLMSPSLRKEGLQQDQSISNYSPLQSSESSADCEMNVRQQDSSLISQTEGASDSEMCKEESIAPSLFMDKKLSLSVRLLLPTAVLVNMALFVYSNICMDAVAVVMTLSSGVFSSIPEPLLAFGLLGTIVSMWEAKVYILAILIAFLSGLWPYIKLFSLLACFLLPPPRKPQQSADSSSSSSSPKSSTCRFWTVSTERRLYLLSVVETFGKWGLLDFYVMVLMMCAFHLNMSVDMATGPLLVEVLVKPNFGFFSFLLATMMSHASSHVMLACHRHVEEVDKSLLSDTCKAAGGAVDEVQDLEPKVFRLIDAEFFVHEKHLPRLKETMDRGFYSTVRTQSAESLCGENETAKHYKLKISEYGIKCLSLLLVGLIALVYLATFTFSFTFEFQGLVGWLLQRQQVGSNVSDYSFDSVGWHMQEGAGISSSGPEAQDSLKWQILSMQICYFAFGLVAPTMLLLALLALWFKPLSLTGLVRTLVASDIIGAWTAIDVFCVSVAAALLEIRQFAAFIVGDNCGDINAAATYFLQMKPGEITTCFDVITTLKTVSLLSFPPLHPTTHHSALILSSPLLLTFILFY
jgi:Paraquat-inducible protein A